MGDIKPGWKTTEFWLGLFSALVGFAVLAGVVPGLDTETGNALTAAITQIVEGVVALVAIVGPLLGYIRSRATVKAAAASNGRAYG